MFENMDTEKLFEAVSFVSGAMNVIKTWYGHYFEVFFECTRRLLYVMKIDIFANFSFIESKQYWRHFAFRII
jgi:hypothetical protein